MQSTLLLLVSVRWWCLANVLLGLVGCGGALTQRMSVPGSAPAVGITLSTVRLARTRVLLNMTTLMVLPFWVKFRVCVLNSTPSLPVKATLRTLPLLCMLLAWLERLRHLTSVGPCIRACMRLNAPSPAWPRRVA